MEDGKNSDWTAGIVAIVAALLIGAGVPAGLYYGWYGPLVKEDMKLLNDKQQIEFAIEIHHGKERELNSLKDDAKVAESELRKLESSFAKNDKDVDSIKEVVEQLQKLADDHHLKPLPERAGEQFAKPVYRGAKEVTWKHGLKASEIVIEASATFHDFGRFVASVESMAIKNEDGVASEKVLVVIPQMWVGNQDKRIDVNSKVSHVHRHIWKVLIVKQRDIDAVGRPAVAKAK